MEKIKEWVQNYVTENPGSDGATAWKEFTGSKIGKKFVNDTTTENYIKGFISRIGAENAGVTNDKGQMSKKENPAVLKLDNKESELKLLPDNIDTQALVKGFEAQKNKVLKNINGKPKEEQEKIVSEFIREEKPEEEQKKEIVFSPKVPEFSNTAKEIEQAERNEEINKKESAFLKSWASTHPTWRDILSSKDLSWGQKVALVGSALANIGANVTLGAKAGFEHSAFNAVPWDFKQAIDKYTNQEIETVLGGGEQSAKSKAAAAEFWESYQKENGKEKTDELLALVDLYGDNPTILQTRLSAMGINQNANEMISLYANAEKVNVSESTKQKILETEAKAAEVKAQEILTKIKNNELDISDKTKAKLIEATNALNGYNNTRYKSDEKTYNLEKAGRYVKSAINTVEGIAGALTGNIVGAIDDGIVKAPGMAQKIVRADGTEIELDPNDNIYATKNKLTTDKDNGSDIIHMTQNDKVITLQKKLGYSGGMIRKDFEYYLNKLRG